MRSFLSLLLACLAMGIVVAGCGDDDDDDGGGGTGADTPEQAAPGGGRGTEVAMKDIKFDPAKLTIKAGETVEWVNDDSVAHDVTADQFKSGAAGGMASGDTFEHTFEQPGTYDYVCTVHPGMEGTVAVK
jgi:plastocyanin